MNLFDYELTINKVNGYTTVKDIEAELRSQAETIPEYIHSPLTEKGLESEILKFRAYEYTLHTFSNKSVRKLPDFIYEKTRNYTQFLLKTLFGKTYNNLEYSKYIEIFKYTAELTLPRTDGLVLLNMNKTIKNNPQPYKIDLGNFTTTSYYYQIADECHLLSKIYRLEHYKQEDLDPSINYTLLESMLSDLYRQFNKNKSIHQTNQTRHLELVRVLDTIQQKIV